jgi:hypothetical protein
MASTSAIRLNIRENDLRVDATVQLLSDTTFVVPPSNMSFMWTICSVNPDTLAIIEDPTASYNYTIQHTFTNLYLTAANLVNNKMFSAMLFPEVDNISAFYQDGIQTSLQVYTTGVSSPTNPTLFDGRRIQIDNYNHMFTDVTNTVGILTGSWLYSTTSSGTNVSGTINYDTGYLTVDFHNVTSLAFESPSSIYIKYRANYSTALNTYAPFVSNATLNMLVENNDSKSFVLSCITNQPSVTADAYYFHAPSIKATELNYNYENAILSAVQLKRNSESYFTSGVSNYWPNNYYGGRAISWRGTSNYPTSAMKLSAKSLKTGNLYDISNKTLSGWSVSADIVGENYLDYMQLTSTSVVPQTYSVSAFFAEAEYDTDTRAPWVYTFSYDPIVSEDLVIETISQTLTSEILKVNRQVVGKSTTYTSDVLYPLKWEQTSNYPTSVSACTGLVPSYYTITNYYNCLSSITLTGNVGLVFSVSLCASNGIVSGYNDIYGVDYLFVKYQNDPDNIYTLQVSYSGVPFLNSSSIYGTHTFQMYSAPTGVIISAVQLDNEPFTRSLTAKMLKNTQGVYLPLHPSNKIKWNMSDSPYGSSKIYNIDGSEYNPNSFTTDTVIVELTTDTFDILTGSGSNRTFNLRGSAFDGYNYPSSPMYLTSANHDVVVDSFPTGYTINLRTNYEDTSAITDMYRLTSANYTLSTVDNSWFGNSVVNGTRLVEFGDGRTTSAQTTSILCEALTPCVSTITLTRSGVSASTWLSSHTFDVDMNLHFVSRFLSADFIAYPTYVFTSSSTQVINSLTGVIETRGVSSYDVNHTETFIISAREQSADNYVWSINTDQVVNILSYNQPVIEYTTTTLTAPTGNPIKLGIYNNELPLAMPETYRSDVNGSVSQYPNTKQTDDSNNLFQNIRMLDYDTPTLDITTSNNFIITTNYTLTATNSVSYPSSTPLFENLGINQWMLSTVNWTVTGTDNDFSTVLSVGFSDAVAGILKYGSTAPLSLILTRTSYTTIPNNLFEPQDWGISINTNTVIENINYAVAPVLSFTPIYRYATINNNIYVYNNTISSNLVTAFNLYDGYSNYYYITSYDDVTITGYPSAGTYNFTITGYLVDGTTYTNTINNSVVILEKIDEYDSEITRVYGAETLALPKSLEDVRIPINEWAISENFNNAITKLNNNYEYMVNMTKYYSLPPIDFIGWLGSYMEDVSVKFGWNFTNYTPYYGLSASLANQTIKAANDITSKNSILYVADDNNIKLFDLSLNPPLLNIITQKTVDDQLGTIKAIDVDSSDRIYALDKTNNRVLVYDAYNTNDIVPNKLLLDWGGLGGPNAKLKLNNPNDLVIDKFDNVWISDTGNKAIKKYTRTGSWLQTILPSEITGDAVDNGGIISIAFDLDNNMHVLTSNKVYKYTYEGVYITSYTCHSDPLDLPLKIDNMYNSGFLYICYKTHIMKIQQNGAYAGTIGTEIYDANFTASYHDENNSLYVANTKNILQYFDINVINNSLDQKINDVKWSLDDLLVDKNEYIQDWVCNVTFKRFWDNIELFRRCLLGSVTYITTNGTPQIVLNDYTPTEYEQMYLSPKEDIFIGINELVTADVLNRCITQIYNNMNNLLTHI